MSNIILDNDSHGTYHLANNQDLYEIQRDNNFEFVVTGIDKLMRASTTADDNEYITNGQEVLRLSVNKASIPNFTQEIITIKRGNSVMKAAGVPTFSEGSLEVNDYIGADTKSVLMAWQKLSYDVKTERVGRMSQYKKDCTLIEYTPDYQQVRYWNLIGCWVSGISEPEFNMESGSKKTITATIQYDKAYMYMPDDE